jgi:hypothetical protein
MSNAGSAEWRVRGLKQSHVACRDKRPLASCFAYGSVICSNTFACLQVESDTSAQQYNSANICVMSWPAASRPGWSWYTEPST